MPNIKGIYMNNKNIMRALIFSTILNVSPLVALAEDSIECPESDDRAHATCIVIPEKDGIFKINFEAKAQGNGHGTPTISTEISIDNDPNTNKQCWPKHDVAWQDNLGGAKGYCARKFKAGEIYTIDAVTGNSNAASVSAILTVSRVGK